MVRNFTVRNKQPEIMDQPGLESGEHRDALRGLERINWISGSAGVLWSVLRRLAEGKKGPLRILDIATGGGDIPIRLAQRARRAGLPMEFAGVDVSATAIAHAAAQAKECGVAVDFRTLDVLRGPLPTDYDVLTCSLFLHHLEADEATQMLARMGQAARAAVLVHDLNRSRLGYWVAWLGTRILSRSPVVHVDGPRSVEGAFTMAEAQRMAAAAGLSGATVSWRWPFRFLLEWRRARTEEQVPHPGT